MDSPCISSFGHPLKQGAALRQLWPRKGFKIYQLLHMQVCRILVSSFSLSSGPAWQGMCSTQDYYLTGCEKSAL